MTAPWWRRGVLYHIYPRSFMDTNGDGIGDLRGIAARLDYLCELGVAGLWLSPIYPSPMADFGYDVEDYANIDPVFGTLEDFDALLAEVHHRGLKLVLDFVPNHTSERHPWFLESRASRASPRRDWYIWRDPASDGGPPNNWLSSFGGSAWQLDAGTGQYYYHAFLKSQPDLNWRNPRLRAAMHDVLRFWLDRGVDGFRVDVLWHLIKDAEFRDNPPNPGYRHADPPHAQQVMLYSADRPEIHEVVAELRGVVDEYDERVLIGEIYLPIERLVAYYGADLQGAHLPFNFQLIETAWDARGIARMIDQYDAAVPARAWPNWVLGNHDKPRIATRVGVPQARVAAMLLLTLRGMPTMYYGDELGMRDVPIPPELVQDPYEKRVPGLGLGRDPCRTPMQWDASTNAGFTSARPWLPVADDFPVVNVEAESDDPTSILALYRALIRLRRAEPALVTGRYEPVVMTGDLVAYLRKHDGKRFLVALNLGGEPLAVAYSEAGPHARIALSTHLDRSGERVTDTLNLRADEGVVVVLHAEG
jgi:alpha-glucosidase